MALDLTLRVDLLPAAFLLNTLFLLLIDVFLFLEVVQLILWNALGVTVYEALDRRQVVAHMDALALVELRSLDDPHVVSGVMAERHTVACKIFLQQLDDSIVFVILVCRRIARLDLVRLMYCVPVGFALFALLLLVLLDENHFILVEMPEDEVIVEQFIGVMFTAILHLVQPFIEFLRTFRNVVKGIKGVHELDHGL